MENLTKLFESFGQFYKNEVSSISKEDTEYFLKTTDKNGAN